MSIGKRINEVLDFASNESPYRAANKGWITDDIFLEWGSQKKSQLSKKDELANVSIFWGKEIFAIIFTFVFILSTLVFAAFSLFQSHPAKQEKKASLVAKINTSSPKKSIPKEIKTVSTEPKAETNSQNIAGKPKTQETKPTQEKQVELSTQVISQGKDSNTSTTPSTSTTPTTPSTSTTPPRTKVKTAVDLFQPKRL